MTANNVFKSIHFIAFILVVVGALNWGLIGVADFNLVAVIFGDGGVSRVVYTLVGLAALIVLYTELMMDRAADNPGIRRPAVQA
jgi:uncharacterized protein